MLNLGRQLYEEKSAPPEKVVTHLGGVNDFTAMKSGILTMSARDDKVKLAKNRIKEVLRSKRLSQKTAASLAGDLAWIQMTAFDRTSKGGLRPIYERAYEASDYWTNELEAAMRFNQFVLENYKPARIDACKKGNHKVLLYSDAEWEVNIR